MRSMNLKKIAAMSALGLVAVLGVSTEASAQYTRNDQESVYQRQQRVANQIANKQINGQQRRNNRQYNDRWNNNNGNRYRVNRNGRYYNTDQRGANLLRQAVNAGYQQGYRAGQVDRSNRRRSSWTSNNIYRSGSYGYQSYVDRSQYQYYFQQGFQRGYQDGYNSRNQFGSNGTNILGAILGQILNIQTY